MKKVMVMGLAMTLISGAALAQREAPAFELPDVNGTVHSLAQYVGKTVVLEWTNYDCPFVRKFYSVGAMQGWQENFTGEGVIWLSICSSAPGTQGHFSKAEWLKRIDESKVKATAVLLDAEGSVGKAYGAKTTPHMYIISAEGKIVYEGGIDDKRSTRSSDIEGAGNYVVEALTALKSGEPIKTATSTPYGCSVKYANP